MSVDEGQPFYDGSKIYYQINTETYIPEMFELNGVEYAKLFPSNKINNSISSQIIIKGKVSIC